MTCWRETAEKNQRPVNTQRGSSGSIESPEVRVRHAERSGNCGRGEIKPWKPEKNLRVYPSAAVGNISMLGSAV